MLHQGTACCCFLHHPMLPTESTVFICYCHSALPACIRQVVSSTYHFEFQVSHVQVRNNGGYSTAHEYTEFLSVHSSSETKVMFSTLTLVLIVFYSFSLSLYLSLSRSLSLSLSLSLPPLSLSPLSLSLSDHFACFRNMFS